MGMYTELVLSCNIKPEPYVIEILKFMCTGQNEPTSLPFHQLFVEDTRWYYMFRSASYYHVPRAHASIMYDEIGKYWTLIVRCDFKNYMNEVDMFVDWITPYVKDHGDDKQMIGYSRYEENIEPTILYVPATIPSTEI